MKKRSKIRKNEKNFLPDYQEFFKGTNEKNVVGKLLWGFFKTNKYNFFISNVLYIIKHSGLWAVPIVTANVIDIVSNPGQRSLWELFLNGIILCILVSQNMISHVAYINATSSSLRSIGAGLRNSLIKKLQQLSITYHNEMKSGALQSKFVRDVEAIEQLLNQIMMNLIPSILTVILTVVITVSKSRIVSLFFLCLIPVNVILVRAFNGKISIKNRAFRKEVENVSTEITTMLEMIPVTKAHGLEDKEVNKMQSSLNQLKSAGMSLDKAQAQFGSMAWVVSTLMSVICLIFSGYLAYCGKITVGDVVLYQTYFSTISGCVQALLNIYPEFAKGTESIKSVSEIMISDRIENNDNKIKLRYVHGSVQFNNASYMYPGSEKRVIKNLSFSAEPGDCVAFVGASGSGKSTVMNMIIGFLQTTDGEILIDGKPIDMLNLHDFRKFVSVVPQNSILFNGTIKDNIVYGLDKYTEKQLEKVLELANIREFTDRMPDGIDSIVEEHGANLSGGQKQRISIARAMMRDPKIIILDEATSALDNISEHHVKQAMAELIAGRTTFIVAHRLSTIRDANKIIVMENGECVESGNFDELMARKGKFYELKTLNDGVGK